MGYRFYNPNPNGKNVGDCVFRALSKVLNFSWERTYAELSTYGFMMGDAPTSNEVWGNYLIGRGFNRYIIPDTCPNCYTIDRIYDMIYCELDEISKKQSLDVKDVELIDKFVDIIKDIDQIGMEQDGYSQMNMRSIPSRTGYGRNSYRGNSYRDGSYSRDESKAHMLNELGRIMDMAVDDRDRQAVQKLMSEMERS